MSIEAGNILRETREQKGVSIKEASDVLHIRIPYLQALENGRAEIIPSAVQARGFLRIYAEYLDLNATDIIQEWDNPGSTALSAKKNTGSVNFSQQPDQSAIPDNQNVQPSSIPYQSIPSVNSLSYRQNPTPAPMTQNMPPVYNPRLL